MTFKEFIETSDKLSLLTEGGLAGHMAHLYDNWNLTFTQIKEILIAAAQGQLQGTEKTDGQNLFISYSIKENRAKAARNKGDLEAGGINSDEISKRYKGKNIQETFVDALNIFELAAQGLTPKQQLSIFGPNTNVFYNAEIMDPRTPNVINYDKKTLLIHQVGHIFVDSKTHEITSVNITKYANELDRLIHLMQDKISNEQYSIIRNATIKLQQLSDKTILKQSLQRIDQLMKRSGIKNDNTIRDYLFVKVREYIRSQVTLPESVEVALASKIVDLPGSGTIHQITKDLPPDQRVAVKTINRDTISILKYAIIPIENIIHQFSAEMLKDLQSAFIIDNRKEVKRLQKEVANAIQALQNSGSDTAHEVLKLQLQKLKNVKNISTAIEGFVFDYNGKTYKFTGNFAPINQLLGLFKYGRGSEKITYEETHIDDQSLLEVFNPTNFNLVPGDKKVSVIIGRFNPWTKGHASLTDLTKYPVVIGLVKGKSTLEDKERNPFSTDLQKEIIRKSNNTKIIDIVEFPSANIPQIVSMLRNKGYEMQELWTGADRAPGYARQIKEYIPRMNSTLKLKILDRDEEAADVSGISATKVRQAIKSNNQASVRNMMINVDNDLFNKMYKQIFSH